MVFQILGKSVSIRMRQHAQVRLKRLGQRIFVNLAPAILCHSVSEFSKYPAFRFAPKQPIVRQNHVSQKVHALTGIENGTFFGMQRELQLVPDKFSERIKEVFQIFFVGRHNHKVVGVARVMFNLQIVLNELVEFVHVNIGEKLRCKVADRHPLMFKKR